MNNWILVFLILLRAAPLVVSIFILLFVIAIALIFFLAQQMYFVSINKTQVELEKYDYLTELRREKGDYTPVVNIYDKGIIGNWKELLFPTRKAEHERVYIPPEDVNEDGFLKKKQNKKNENDNKRISVKNPKLAKKHK
ncbi:hypothetical protein TRFO_07326 [Tritrichomonas foetus]|uniref:Uncharacterized protein n=1 Tax=Tritrichomonas foetus TaxID=1144522 RepID=A0A1J4JUG4_9EUKA|nr:hypothetical protein TRFO_07326 [Tritrichomonas foetus]|eukprot:OHT02120.1 hypothetical protein TRFO_07326 [Tritrichomonas foetus]